MLALTLLVLGQYITLQNEGTTVGQARRLNCVGSGVTCSVSGSTGTLTVTGGGGGGAPPACTTGKAVTSDGDALICTAVLYASDVQCGSACVADAEISAVSGAKVSGAVATASALASDPTDCSGGQYATGIAANGNLTCSTPTGANFVEAEVDFGAQPGSDLASVVVTGQAWVSATSKISCAVALAATTDRAEGAEDALLEQLRVAWHTRVNGTGFTVVAHAPNGRANGKFKVHCTGSSS